VIYFVDLEASSLEPSSFPIEVAWVDENGQGEGYLVRPESLWLVDPSAWSPQAERLHGISLAQLAAEGKPAAWVARRVLAVLGPERAVGITDVAGWDQAWLSKLLDVVRRDRHPRLISFPHLAKRDLQQVVDRLQMQGVPHDQIADRCTEIFNMSGDREQMRHRVRHRALPDAEGLWWRWRELQRLSTDITT
jgi:hypothetical protein